MTEDSLEFEQGTFRVGFPQPQTVENENEFVTNSGRRLKFQENNENAIQRGQSRESNKLHNKEHAPLHPVPPTQFENPQLGISDSLQAQLHLSLDRLSENFYDPDDINRIKNKPGGKPVKSYPAVPQPTQPLFNGATAKDSTSHPTPDTTENEQPLDSHSHFVPQDSIAAELMPSYNQFKLDNDDDDDIHTVVVDDSLDEDADEDVRLPEPIQPAPTYNLQREPIPAPDDPYANLRYDPPPRQIIPNTTPNTVVNGQTVHQYTPIDFRNVDSSPKLVEESELGFHQQESWRDGGAIQIHNPMLSPTRDSAVRLSSNPDHLSKVNSEYEEEFNRMLELEARQQEFDIESRLSEQAESYYSQHPSQIKYNNDQHVVNPKGPTYEHEPKVTSAPPLRTPYNEHTASHTPTPPKRSQTNRGAVNHKVAKRPPKHHPPVPNPPSQPRNNRDYVELNKLRLGRKSNSASYLQMYSKRNKPKVEVPPRRNSSSNKPTNPVASEISNEIDPSQENDLSVEENWLYQAQRLKAAKDGRAIPAKPAATSSLKDVGNVDGRPKYSPRQIAFNYKDSPRHQPLNPGPTYGSNRGFTEPSRYSDGVNLSNHPAFAYNPQPPDVAQYLPQSDPLPGNLTPDSRLNGGYRSTDHHHINHMDGSYHRMTEEDFNHQSPLMQAYHQRQQQAVRRLEHTALPPSHGIPMSPRKVNGEFPLSPPESYTTHTDGNQHDRRPPILKKRVNFDPSIYRTPPQMPRNRLSKYPVPLPPTPPYRVSYERRSISLSPTSGEKYTEPYPPDGVSNAYQAVPVLPPISMTSSSAAIEHSPRLDPSDAASGSYLKQHNLQKKAASYKKYTLNDYKSLKRDINLGGLGPDLTAAKIKMDKIQRGKKYAEFIRQQHKTHQSKPDVDDANEEQPHRFTMATESDQKLNEKKEKRARAINYARQVPRPKLPPEPKVQPRPDSSRAPTIGGNIPNDEPQGESYEDDVSAVDWQLLRSLRERHEREKVMVAAISPNRVT